MISRPPQAGQITQLLLGQVGVAHRSDQTPVPADRATLQPGHPQVECLELDSRVATHDRWLPDQPIDLMDKNVTNCDIASLGSGS